ncbi:MAG TPA: hypothetical protein VGU67_14480 [Edaphobacter sp.]|nr:hypothetical protein [Edaphobacter sp.]
MHFIGPDGQSWVGPWLLFDSGDEVKTILRWGGIRASQLAEYENDIRRWNFSSIGLELSDAQFRRLIERGRPL